jgi:hypothetical protein
MNAMALESTMTGDVWSLRNQYELALVKADAAELARLKPHLAAKGIPIPVTTAELRQDSPALMLQAALQEQEAQT